MLVDVFFIAFMYINRQCHSFHLIDPSPCPFSTAMCAFFLTFSGVLTMQGFCVGYNFFMFIFELLCFSLFA